MGVPAAVSELGRVEVAQRRMAAVNVQDLAGDEARPFLLEDSVGDLAHPSERVHGG